MGLKGGRAGAEDRVRIPGGVVSASLGVGALQYSKRAAKCILVA
jgi:hypothetical protein